MFYDCCADKCLKSKQLIVGIITFFLIWLIYINQRASSKGFHTRPFPISVIQAEEELDVSVNSVIDYIPSPTLANPKLSGIIAGDSEFTSQMSRIGLQNVNYSAFEEWRTTNEKRRLRVRDTCHKYSTSLRIPFNYNQLLFDKKHHVAYCRNAKVATTAWLSEFLQKAGIDITNMGPDEIHQKVKEVFPPLNPKEADEEIHRYLSFIIVRHPFARLVSAYRDKIPENYRNNLYQKMIDTYRNVEDIRLQKNEFDDILLAESLPSFREFVLYVSHEVSSCISAHNWTCLMEVDVHWRPYFARCTPCDLHYDVIAKMETLQEDSEYIKRLGFSSVIKDESSAISHAHSTKGSSTIELTEHYFSSLSDEEKRIVYQTYFYDFQLFDYSPDVII